MMKRAIRRFRANQRGSAGTIFALTAIPMLLLAGGTVDYAIILNERAKLQSALDTATLSAMQRKEMDEAEIIKLVRDSVLANIGKNGRMTLRREDISVSVEEENGAWLVSARAKASVRTPFWGMFSNIGTGVKVRSDVRDSVTALDVVLVLDNTGSMEGSKIEDLKEASKNLVQTLRDKAGANSLVRVGLIPFNHYVNIGTQYCGEDWLSSDCEGADLDNMPLPDLLILLRRTTSLSRARDRLLGDLVDYVEAGRDPGPFDSCDSGGWGWGWGWSARPVTGGRRGGGSRGGNGMSPFSGWGWWKPDPGDDDSDSDKDTWCDLVEDMVNQGVIYWWERDDVAIDEAFVRQVLIDNFPSEALDEWEGVVGIRDDDLDLKDDSYDEQAIPAIKSEVYERRRLVSRRAPMQIVPLGEVTDDDFHEELNSQIDAMEAKGWTYIPIGLVWGWRALSEQAPLTESADSGDGRKTHKVIVLLTDGENTCRPANDGEGHVACSNRTGFADEADRRTRKLCRYIKAKGIDIITVTFDVDTRNVKRLLKRCSSRGYYDAGVSDLGDVFEDIATKLVRMHLSR